MYESVRDVSKYIQVPKQLQSDVLHLPQVAAELLISGYPLELMDGDTSHLPLTWVTSILDEVKKKMLGDKQYCLSSQFSEFRVQGNLLY